MDSGHCCFTHGHTGYGFCQPASTKSYTCIHYISCWFCWSAIIPAVVLCLILLVCSIICCCLVSDSANLSYHLLLSYSSAIVFCLILQRNIWPLYCFCQFGGCEKVSHLFFMLCLCMEPWGAREVSLIIVVKIKEYLHVLKTSFAHQAAIKVTDKKK